MELQGSGWYVKLSLGMHNTRDIHGRTPVLIILQSSTSSAQTRRQTHLKVPRNRVYIYTYLLG